MTENTAHEQIDELAKFIMAEVPGEPSRSEGAVECAIRWMRARLAPNMTDKPLRALVEKWREEAVDYGRLHQNRRGYEIDFSDEARSVVYERVADELEAALDAPAQDAVADAVMIHAALVEATPPTQSGNAALVAGFRVVRATAPQHAGEQWEVYDASGNGGVVHIDDIKDLVVRGLLDALAGQAQANQPADGDAKPWTPARAQALADDCVRLAADVEASKATQPQAQEAGE